jgi:hypothetical protein
MSSDRQNNDDVLLSQPDRIGDAFRRAILREAGRYETTTISLSRTARSVIRERMR